jgi:hypothetical protein
MRNFHLSPERDAAQFRAEAERTPLPAASLARHAEIAAYALEMAGTKADLDTELESAGVEHLVKAGWEKPGSAER